MLRHCFHYLAFLLLIIYGTGCSVIKNSQNASHPLVNEVDRRTLNSRTTQKKQKTQKTIAQDFNEQKTIPKVQEIPANNIQKENKILPKKELAEKNTIKNSIEAQGQAQKLIEEAQKYLGTPYKLGGTTQAGMDCSGFVMTVFKSQGIQLPRISPDQYKFGKPISIEEIQPGDLMFFSTPSKPHTIGHSAICVAIEEGKIKFIHAASTGVRYDYLLPGYYLKHYKGACRILTPHLSTNK
ncbi:MAG: hypothetical protein KatS3mg035_0240 [Bacteroidia bacterium]|nr:MAG: hypothetical protein KatS3mg035_0240 [Bacteroidia bacterium]